MSIEHVPQEKAARYAAILRERIETQGILRELAGYPNFIVWRYRFIDGQQKKPPYSPNTNLPANPNDPATWNGRDSVTGTCKSRAVTRKEGTQ
jgi:hypothetical protein